MKEWRLFEKNIIISHFITVSIIIKRIKITHMLINIDYLAYEVINSIFIKKINFKRINIPVKKLIEIKKKKSHIDEVVKVKININKHKQNIYFYII